MLKTGNDFARAIDFLDDLRREDVADYGESTAVWLIENLDPTSQPLLTFFKARLRPLLGRMSGKSSGVFVGATGNGTASYSYQERKTVKLLPIHRIGRHEVIHGNNSFMSSLVILPLHFASRKLEPGDALFLNYTTCKRCGTLHTAELTGDKRVPGGDGEFKRTVLKFPSRRANGCTYLSPHEPLQL